LKKVNVDKLLTKDKTLILAYDQGLEHGPTDFNELNHDPKYIINIANKGKFNALALQKGIAEKYRSLIKVPLILKLNGKTQLSDGDPVARPVATVKEAISLRASAVGYTLYIGSAHEDLMFKEFSQIQKEAHEKGLAVVTWIYPRGGAIGKNEKKYMAYAARVGLELGADIAKIKYNGNPKDLEWAVKCAGRCKIVIAGGVKKGEKQLLKQVSEIKESGASGLAIGRNIWQHPEPFEITKKIRKELF
jgi:fructose-bisphosphate aldolase, class I